MNLIGFNSTMVGLRDDTIGNVVTILWADLGGAKVGNFVYFSEFCAHAQRA